MIMKIRRQNSLNLFLQLLIFTLSLIKPTKTQFKEPQLDFLGGKCLTSETIRTNSTYHTNILSLLNDFISFSSVNQFFTSSSGNTTDRVNGYYLCRPDLSLSTCRDCIESAINNQFREFCFNKKEVVLWYEECMFRYTNNSISASNNVTEPWQFNYSNFNVSHPLEFPKLVKTTMEALISEAVSLDNPQKFFAHGQANYTTFEGFFGMVMCRPDMTVETCKSCLFTALGRISSCCSNSLAEWTWILLPNCQLRYDTAPFIFSSQQPLLPPEST